MSTEEKKARQKDRCKQYRQNKYGGTWCVGPNDEDANLSTDNAYQQKTTVIGYGIELPDECIMPPVLEMF